MECVYVHNKAVYEVGTTIEAKLSFSHQDDSKTSKDTKHCITKHLPLANSVMFVSKFAHSINGIVAAPLWNVRMFITKLCMKRAPRNSHSLF